MISRTDLERSKTSLFTGLQPTFPLQYVALCRCRIVKAADKIICNVFRVQIPPMPILPFIFYKSIKRPALSINTFPPDFWLCAHVKILTAFGSRGKACMICSSVQISMKSTLPLIVLGSMPSTKYSYFKTVGHLSKLKFIIIIIIIIIKCDKMTSCFSYFLAQS